MMMILLQICLCADIEIVMIAMILLVMIAMVLLMVMVVVLVIVMVMIVMVLVLMSNVGDFHVAATVAESRGVVTITEWTLTKLMAASTFNTILFIIPIFQEILL